MQTATPIIEECKIAGSLVHGIYITGAAGGLYKGNSVLNSGWFSISIDSVGTPQATHNTVSEGSQGQVIIRGSPEVNPVF